MADRCPTCRLVVWTRGVEFNYRMHCPNSPSEHIQVRDPLACLRLGIEHRDRTIAAAKELLKKQNETIGSAIDRLGAGPE